MQQPSRLIASQQANLKSQALVSKVRRCERELGYVRMHLLTMQVAMILVALYKLQPHLYSTVKALPAEPVRGVCSRRLTC